VRIRSIEFLPRGPGAGNGWLRKAHFDREAMNSNSSLKVFLS
jgi:hypothetical protein